MTPFLEDLVDRPLPHRLAIWGGTILLLVLLMWSSMYSPKHTEFLEVRDKVDSLRLDVTKERRLAMNLRKYKKEVKELDIQLQFALQELPDKSEIPELLSSISSLAKDSGLEVDLFKVNAEQFDEFYARVPVEIAVSGTFHQIATFFDKVAQLPRIVNISQINLVNPTLQDDKMMLKVGCIATTFRYITPEEQDLRSKVGGKKRGR